MFTILNSVAANAAREEADAMPEEVPHAFPHAGEP